MAEEKGPSILDDSYSPPVPETMDEVTEGQVDNFLHAAKAAFDQGVWQTDASEHARKKCVDPALIEGGTTLVEPKPGQKSLKLAYFFSGVQRKCSVAEHLRLELGPPVEQHPRRPGSGVPELRCGRHPGRV